MKPDPIFIKPGTFSIAGGSGERLAEDLETHIGRLQGLLGAELKEALAGAADPLQQDPAAMISFTGAFTGVSTLLHFCSFTRGIMALEKGMETPGDKQLAGKLRELLVPIVVSQCRIMNTNMTSNLAVKVLSIQKWYQDALVEVQAINGFIGRLG